MATNLIKFTYGDKTYTAEPAKHFRLPDGTVLRLVSTAEDVATVELAKKPNSITDAAAATEFVEPTKSETSDVARPGEQTAGPKEPPTDAERKAALKPIIDDLKAQWHENADARRGLDAVSADIEGKLAAVLIEYDKGRARGVPPTPVTLNGKLMKAQRSRKEAPPSLIPVAAVGESV